VLGAKTLPEVPAAEVGVNVAGDSLRHCNVLIRTGTVEELTAYETMSDSVNQYLFDYIEHHKELKEELQGKRTFATGASRLLLGVVQRCHKVRTKKQDSC